MSGEKTHNSDEANTAFKNDPIYFTVEEVAKKIGKSVRTVHSYVDLGLLGCKQDGKHLALRFTQEQQDAYFAKMERKRKNK
jgi:DNA-binding transcriptional MerR regulator